EPSTAVVSLQAVVCSDRLYANAPLVPKRDRSERGRLRMACSRPLVLANPGVGRVPAGRGSARGASEGPRERSERGPKRLTFVVRANNSNAYVAYRAGQAPA